MGPELTTYYSVHGTTGDTPVEAHRSGDAKKASYWLSIGPGLTIFFDGYGDECQDNLLAFCDNITRQADMLRQDMADHVA